MKRLLWISLLIFLLPSCVPQYTVFEGNAKIKDGPTGCEAKCKAFGMDLVGMVVLGEYTDGCICKKRGEQMSMQDVGETLILSSSVIGGGTAAIEMDRRRREAQGPAIVPFASGGLGL